MSTELDTIGHKRLSALAAIDSMPRDLRECVHDFGLPIVSVLTKHGVRNPRHIREIVREIWAGPRQVGQGDGVQGAIDFALLRGGISYKTLRRLLADFSMAIVPTTPTRAMIEASMAEVSGGGEIMTKREKHIRRLRAAVMAELHKGEYKVEKIG